MLLTRAEMTFDFQGDRFDPVRDADFLAWAFNQFLYGEVTGIQIGHWLLNAPDFDAARFLAKQAIEEFQHVDNFLKILSLLDREPARPHRLTRFLSTGMMPDTWEEHVALEMAQGEGAVLMAFYALIDTVDHPEIVAILNRAVKQEERHTAFGEEQTARAVAGRPGLRRRLVGLNLVSLAAMRRLGAYMGRKLGADQSVLRHLPDFLDAVAATCELRMRRIGLIDRPLVEISGLRKTLYIAEAYGAKFLRALCGPLLRILGMGRRRRLTDTYLTDPFLDKYRKDGVRAA